MQKLSLMLIITFMLMITAGAAMALDVEFDSQVSGLSDAQIRLTSDVFLVDDIEDDGNEEENGEIEDENEVEDAESDDDDQEDGNAEDDEAAK